MAIEARRACGYRKVGGTYLVGGRLAAPCGRLPVPLAVCPACGHGIKPARGFTWVVPFELFGLRQFWFPGPVTVAHPLPAPTLCLAPGCSSCKLGGKPFGKAERAGLLWVGSQFYKTPDLFTAEAACLGVSRRIARIPHGFELEQTWVLLAHLFTPYQYESKMKVGGVPVPEMAERPGVFAFFLPERIERILTKSMATPAELERLEARGITPVIVPDNDPDHCGDYEAPDEQEALDFAAAVAD
jgi:hypothetical protein